MKKKLLCFGLALVFVLSLLVTGAKSVSEAASGSWGHDTKGYYYKYSDGTYAKNKWLSQNSRWYYFNQYGYMVTGWKQIGTKWYFFDTKNGFMRTGWYKTGGKWYYFAPATGVMVVGWKQIGKKWYFFKEGVMQTGWKKISGNWYFFGTDGYMTVGWKEISGKWYFFADGVMATGKRTISGKVYNFGSDGALIEESGGGNVSIKVPSTSGWTSKQKIYAYSWDDDFFKKLSVVLDEYPQFKPYVEFVNLGCASNDAFELIESAMNSNKYPSLIPADSGSAKYWVESSKTMDLSKLGFNSDMMKNSYQYAIDYGTYNGKLKAVTWQSTAGSVFYNRKMAKEVFGTDDPAKIQNQLKDWDSFFAAAEKLKKKGYKIVSSPAEIYYALINSRSSAWFKTDSSGNETFTPDDSIKLYIQYAKKLSDGGYTNNSLMWMDGWADNMQDGGNVFCYFACPWMTGVFTGYGATNGSWGTCVGPTSYYWGGTYVCVGAKTSNQELSAFLLQKLTCDPDIGVKITNKTGDVVNNKEANRRLANGELDKKNSAMKLFGGQNPYAVWGEASSGIKQKAVTDTDKYVEQIIKEAAQDYAGGEYSSVDATVNAIKKHVTEELGIPSK